ncbi:Proteophosphoglycan ppg4, related [Eimeria brunetti]|uniref:Proteophosphoglycan ppg4, related n=1 Tax=Eimeria brunetti TaxID=51314 RepID=U6LUF9_9EIME|nr:Proteophosphoglycan ppg4, related [Eimeria brunetti]
MDEIHAVLELFVSCRGSCWPLVRLEAEQQLLTQHLLMAAPMDKEEIEELIKKCFEADNNGEINFLSFWSGMENLLELLGIRDPSAHVDDKVYGLQVFRDCILAEAVGKHQGPTSSVLLTRDEVLSIIDRTNKSVAPRHSRGDAGGTRRDGESYQGGDTNSSSLFWDEVYRETALLDAASVLSVTELSMMVFGFLKSYLKQESTGTRQPEGDPHDVDQSVELGEPERTLVPDASGARNAVSHTSYAPRAPGVADSTVGATHEDTSSQGQHSHVYGSLNETSASREDTYGTTMEPERWQKGWELEHPREHAQNPAVSRNDMSSVASSTAGGHGRDPQGQTHGEGSESPAADVSRILREVDSEDPFSQLRQLLIFAGEVVERGAVSKKDRQQLRRLNAAAVDCVDRISVEREKRNEVRLVEWKEVNDAVLSLSRMRTEKQQLMERLTNVEHQHSQLQLQQEQQLCERDKVGELQAALASERLERERLQRLLRDKEEDMMGLTHEKDALLERISSQSGEFSRLLDAAHKEKAELSEDHRRKMETLTREKEMLEEKLRSAEDKARAAEAVRQQVQGDAHLSASTLRQRILELEGDTQRQEAEAEENEALILQLQARLEEKAQQVTILEVKNMQQARLLHQVRGVRNSLMQVLQDSKGTEADEGASISATVPMAREPEIMKLKAGMKAALAHIRDLETFIDEMRKEQRRGFHPRYEISAASGSSSARSVQRKHVGEPCGRFMRAVQTLGDELEMSAAAAAPDSDQEVSSSAIEKGNSGPTNAPSGESVSSPLCEQSRVACEGEGEGGGGVVGEASCDAPLSKQPSIREQIVAVEKQKVAYKKAGALQGSGLRRHFQSRAGTSGKVGYFASVLSEPSTTDPVSKEPTSSASLPEAEDIFDPLDLLKSEDSVDTEVQGGFAAKCQPSRTSREAQGNHPDGRARKPSSKSGQSLVSHSSAAAAAVSSNATELPPSGGSPKMSFGHSVSSSGLEMPLEGRRCRSRATDRNTSNERQEGIAESPMAVPSQEAGSALEGRPLSSSGDRSSLSDSLASTNSDGKFLMLTALGEANKSPTASANRRIGDRSQSSKVELATKALDASTLSGMFSMLGACAALPGNAPRGAAASADAVNDTAKNTRSAGGEDSSKAKHKQPIRLSAAATAAISTKDVSAFRSLRCVSQGSVHRVEQPEELLDQISTGMAPGSTDISELTARRGEPTSEESPLTERDQWSPSKRQSPSPKAGHARARRTVSLGITESPKDVEGRDNEEQQKRLPSLTTPVSSAACVDRSSGKDPNLQDLEGSRKASRAIGSVPGQRSGADVGKEVASESGSPTSSVQKRSGALKSAPTTSETCRSRGIANAQRTPRSRSSSSEPPSRQVLPSHGTSTSQTAQDTKTPHETRNTGASGERDMSHPSSRAYKATGCEEQVQTLRRQAPLPGGQAAPQDCSGACKRERSGTCSTREERSLNDQLRPTERLHDELKEERAKLQDEQTASAAALLAAAAGVVDASLQQQQQMIQRQQEHHEDLQRVQQRRIDMLQEQLEHLQKAKDEQRESGEQEQKKLIHTLQAKLEELQKRQDKREQDFQEAHRKLQEELEVQLKKKLEELRCSPRRTNMEAASSCSVGQNILHASYAHRHDTDVRNSHTIRPGYKHATSGEGSSFERFASEQTLHPAAHHDNSRKHVSDMHPFTTVPEDLVGLNAQRVSQLPSSGKLEDDGLNCMPWNRGGTESLGSVGRMDIHNAAADARGQPVADAVGGYICEEHDRCDSDDASSCASSSLMGSQCGLPVHGCSFEDVPTTTSSSFISQSTTPAVCSSMPSQRGNYVTSEGPVDRQIYAGGGDRLLSQSIGAHSRESLLRRHNMRPQPSECVPATPQHIPVNAGQAELSFSSSVVQRISSSTGSLWSPKASRNHTPGVGERAPCCSTAGTSRPHTDSSVSISGTTASSAGCQAGSAEKLLRAEFRYRSESSRHPSDQDGGPRERGTGLGRPQPSVYHPVSRADRVIPMRQAPIDSARFFGSNSTTEKVPCLAGISRGHQGAFSCRDSQLPPPLASARSITSTSSMALPLQSSSIAHTSRLLQQPMNPNQRSPSQTDFLGATSARSITSSRQTDSRSSQTATTKRSRHSRCSESQVPPSPGRPTNESGVRSTRSSGVSTRSESLLCGPRRTVNSLMNKQPRSTTSDVNSARQRRKMQSSTVGADTVGCSPRESVPTERLEGNETTAIMYRRASSSATLPDVDLSRYPPHYRQKTHRGSSRKEKVDDKRQPDESDNAALSAAGESNSSTAASSAWAGFNVEVNQVKCAGLLEETRSGSGSTLAVNHSEQIGYHMLEPGIADSSCGRQVSC